MKPPYIKLYLKDFAFDIQGMTKKQVGEYMLKFLESYRHESIPDEFSDHSLFTELQKSFQNYTEICKKNKKNIEKRYSKKNIDNALESNTSVYQSYENGKPVEYRTNNQEPRTKNQEPEEKKKIIKEKDSPMKSHNVPSVPKGGKVEKPEDVSEDVWTTWLEMRKMKKAVVTPRVVNGLRKEGEKIGWSLESVLEKCAQRNWTGFESAWVAKDMPRLQNNSSYFNNNTLQQGGGGVGYIPTKQEIVEKCKNGAWNDAEQLAPLIGHLRAMRLVAGTGHEKNDLQSLINSADQRLSELTGAAPF